MLSTILIAAAIILLLVLLVPIGFALYQRIKPAPPAKPAPPPRAAPPPPRAERKPVPDMKPVSDARAPLEQFTTSPVPVLRDTSPPPPPPNKAAVDLEATRAPKRDDAPKTGEPGGTEMLEWYGMLRCTGGPLEGQHFIVENDGFYIGRDASMAQIVVNDSRVSKRHLRIVPRNGRVFAIDEGSTNGTFLAAAPAERITEHQLKRGDTLVLADGAATFVYQI